MLTTKLFFVLLFLPGLTHSLNICGDWVQYSNTKCIMVIEKKATEEEAIKSCGELDKESSLLTVHSSDEQEFLNKLLNKYSSISIYAWIAMKYTNGSYKWMDYSDTKFVNWADDAVKDGTEPCVQMSIVKTTLGKWTDASCKRTALIVCQKKQEFNLNTLRTAFESLEKEVKTLKMSTIPMGFLYTQLPKQSAPEILWPHMNWTEVTDEYSGLFFRAGGSGALPFGQIQQANQSVSLITLTNNQYVSKPYYYSTTPSPREMNDIAWDFRQDYPSRQLKFWQTSGEVRPKNTAIRIWKRVE